MKKNIQQEKRQKRERRAGRTRANIFGTKEKPRMSIYKSLKEIYVQLIDDVEGKTLASASSREIKDKKSKKTEVATEVGKLIAKKAKDKGIEKAVFDKGGFKYHGRVKALADSAREGGLKF